MNSELFTFFLQISILLFVSLSFVEIAKKINMPPIIGELLAGIILGPSIFKNIFPEIYLSIFGSNEGISNSLNCFTQLLMLFFMFFLGLEVDLKQSLKRKKTILSTSIFSMIIPMIFGIGIVYSFPNVFTENMMNNNKLYFALFMGTALSISALPIILKILTDLDILNSDVGSIIISSAIINDLVGWSLFAGVIPLVTNKISSIYNLVLSIVSIVIFPLLLIVIIKAFKVAANKFKVMGKTLNIGFIITFIILVAAIGERINVHPFFSVFIVGVVLKNEFTHKETGGIGKSLQPICSNFISPLYFSTIGLKTNFFDNFDFKLVIVITISACLGKILGSILGASLGGMNWKKVMCIGLGMNARGAMEIMIASVALELNIINQKIYVALVIMAIFTSFVSSFGLKAVYNKPEKNDRAYINKKAM